jgi:hypothetical protein
MIVPARILSAVPAVAVLLPRTVIITALALTAVGSLRNVVETISVSRRAHLLPPPITIHNSSIIQSLRSMNREELLRFYLTQCSCTDNIFEETLALDYDGFLLNNNGFFMTRITQFITHELFSIGSAKARKVGRRNRWIGKSFRSAIGINRFGCDHLLHSFDVSYEATRFPISAPANATANDKSIMLRYRRHQPGWWSPWSSMVDELRVVPSPGDASRRDMAAVPELLLGFGSVGWSGGIYNAAPFLLVYNGSKAKPVPDLDESAVATT